MARPARRLGAIALSALTLTFSACGDDGQSVDEFRSQAGEICKDATPSVAYAERFEGFRPGSRAFADHGADYATRVGEMRDRLLDLEVPAALADDFDELTGHLAEMQRFWQEVSEHTQTRQRLIANFEALRHSKAWRDARRLKIDSCIAASRSLALQFN